MQSILSLHGPRALAMCLLAGALFAQRPVLVVGGATPQFTDLPAAVAAAPPGAILDVHPGIYTGFTTNKPLRLRLLFGATSGLIQPAPGAAYAITVNALPPGDEFVILGAGAGIVPGSIGAVRVVNAAAAVVIEGVTIGATGQRSALDVQYSTGVHVRRSVLAGTPGLTGLFTNIVASECVVLSPLGAGAVVADSRFEATRTYFTGTGQPGLRLFSCVARIASDHSTAISASGAPGVPVSAIEASDTLLQFDPATLTLVPNGGAPGYATVGGALQLVEVPTLTAGTAPLGSAATVSMSSMQPRVAGIVLGLLRDSPLFFDLASIWLDTAAPLVIAAGVCDPIGISTQVVIPNVPALRGEIFCLQGITWLANGWPVLSGSGLWVLP